MGSPKIYSNVFETRGFVSRKNFSQEVFELLIFQRSQHFPWGKKQNNIIFQLILVVKNVMFL